MFNFWSFFCKFLAIYLHYFLFLYLGPQGSFIFYWAGFFLSCLLRHKSLSRLRPLLKHFSCKRMSRSCHQPNTALQNMVSLPGMANMQVLSSSCDKGHLCIKSIFCIKVFTPTLKKTKVSKVSKVSVHTTLVTLVLLRVG